MLMLTAEEYKKDFDKNLKICEKEEVCIIDDKGRVIIRMIPAKDSQKVKKNNK